MSVKSVLGRGVGALLPEDQTENGGEKFFYCDIDKIEPNPDQPRKHFDQDKLQMLAESIADLSDKQLFIDDTTGISVL